jgi:hypothetical protein
MEIAAEVWFWVAPKGNGPLLVANPDETRVSRCRKAMPRVSLRIFAYPIALRGESDNRRPMGRPTKSNVPRTALRWNVERAGIEFGLTSQTLRKSLAKASATSDAAGLFTTKQIIGAIYGAFDQEKLATQKQLTRKYQIANAIAEASVLDRAEVMKGLAAVADAMVSRIMASELSRAAKEDLLRDLSSVPLVLEEVAHRQTKLPRGSGAHSEEDQSES